MYKSLWADKNKKRMRVWLDVQMNSQLGFIVTVFTPYIILNQTRTDFFLKDYNIYELYPIW